MFFYVFCFSFSCFSCVSWLETQFFQIHIHFFSYICQFLFQSFNLFLHGRDIDLLLFLKCIHISGDIQIEVVLLDLIEGCPVCVFINFLKGLIGINDLFNVLGPQLEFNLSQAAIYMGDMTLLAYLGTSPLAIVLFSVAGLFLFMPMLKPIMQFGKRVNPVG